MTLQLDLFKSEQECELEQMRRDLSKGLKTIDNVRKGIFARQNEDRKILTEMNDRLAIIERFICQTDAHQNSELR